MILFQLICPHNHPFESWFRDSQAFEDLAHQKQLMCPHCGSSDVKKSLMAPAVSADRGEKPSPRRPSDQDIAALKEHVEKNSEYVGVEFVTEARRMHKGEVPERAIFGEAKPADALKLIEDGVPILPLPFVPNRKMN
ncbi:MAG: DUF1178 family protein [Deltaproteobacteria bacterium]